jgi:hypothetical protein
MSGIAKVSEKMKKKLSFGEYTLSTGTTLAPVEPVPGPSVGRKLYTLSREDADKLQEIFSKRLSANAGSSISQIMSEAITHLYQRETRSPFPSI